MLDAALEYASRGVPIFQVWHAEGPRCGCRALDCVASQAKHPIASTAPAGFKNATTDPDVIRRAYERFPLANIAEATGRYSSVIDIDPAKGGRDTLAGLSATYGPLPLTPKVLTGGGGEHYRFLPVPGLRCSSGRIGPGIDVRSIDGYALLPPSNHVSGGTYLDDVLAPMFETPLADMPTWLAALAMAPQGGHAGNGHTTPDEWADRLQGAPIGQRRAVALQIAGHFLGIHIAPAEVEVIVRGYAARCSPPFPEAEVRELVYDLARRDRLKSAAARRRRAGQQCDPPPTTGVWGTAVAVPVFLQETDEVVDFIEPRLLVRGAITELYSPRGLGKTQVAYAIAVRLSRTGLRVLLVDRDNPRHEIRRRLGKWGGHDAEHFKLITRDKAPALTDAVAWSAFPLDTFDVVIIDSIDASTEGVGEGDSAKPSVAFAAVLDLARRADGPAIMVLGNVVKSGAHSRGSGVLEDRGDVVYEIRDATDLKPSGQKDWWHELAAAGVGDWAQRASRRKRRDFYRLAFIASKFRLGEEPEPFVLEVDHRTEPWSLRDVTADLVEAGHAALTTRISEHEAALARATHDLLAQMRHRADYGKPSLTKGEAEALLQAKGLKRAAARDLVAEGDGRLWRLETAPNPGGKGTVVFLTFASNTPCEASSAAKKDGDETPRQTVLSGVSFVADRMNSGRQRMVVSNPAIHAGPSEGVSSPPSRNIHPPDAHGGEARA
jgi:hypothetical protein